MYISPLHSIASRRHCPYYHQPTTHYPPVPRVSSRFLRQSSRYHPSSSQVKASPTTLHPALRHACTPTTLSLARHAKPSVLAVESSCPAASASDTGSEACLRRECEGVKDRGDVPSAMKQVRRWLQGVGLSCRGIRAWSSAVKHHCTSSCPYHYGMRTFGPTGRRVTGPRPCLVPTPHDLHVHSL